MDQIHPVSEDNLRIENQPIPNRKINNRENLGYSILVAIVIAIWFIVFTNTFTLKNK